MHAPLSNNQEGRIILCHGCFDVLHLGHIRHLQEAAALGDRLVVSITSDEHAAHKGPGRPHFGEQHRREQLLALECVDEVVISRERTAVAAINHVRPAVYVKGADYAGTTDPDLAAERAAVEALGGRMHITSSEKWSSTLLLRNARLSDQAKAYLEGARARGFLEEIMAAFERADGLDVVFVGDRIVDEYRYVRPLAKPSKEFVLATLAAGDERFEGGVVAAGKHGEWARARTLTTARAVTKTRFVDADFARKLFETYSARAIETTEADRREIREGIEVAAAADVVVAYDFGHGFFERGDRTALLRRAKFLAVTAQTNAGNCGFNSAERWKGCDLVCVDEPEARIAVGDRDAPVDSLARQLMSITRIGNGAVMVTCGRLGSVAHSQRAETTQVPAFTDGGIDTMGAGDAFLALAAPLLAAGLDAEKAAFVGNIAGGLKTSILGHRGHVGRADLVKNIEWLLK